MANSLYDKGREGFLTGAINFTSDTINMILVNDSYSPDTSVDQVYSDVSSFVVGSPVALSSKDATSGVANCADVVFSSVAGGSTVAYIVLYKDTGAPSTSTLIALYDTATGLPFSTNGANVTIAIDTGALKLFKL